MKKILFIFAFIATISSVNAQTLQATRFRFGLRTDSVFTYGSTDNVGIWFGRNDTTFALIYRDSTVLYCGSERKMYLNATGLTVLDSITAFSGIRIGNAGGTYVSVKGGSVNYNLILPSTVPTANKVLKVTDALGNTTWADYSSSTVDTTYRTDVDTTGYRSYEPRYSVDYMEDFLSNPFSSGVTEWKEWNIVGTNAAGNAGDSTIVVDAIGMANFSNSVAGWIRMTMGKNTHGIFRMRFALSGTPSQGGEFIYEFRLKRGGNWTGDTIRYGLASPDFAATTTAGSNGLYEADQGIYFRCFNTDTLYGFFKNGTVRDSVKLIATAGPDSLIGRGFNMADNGTGWGIYKIWVKNDTTIQFDMWNKNSLLYGITRYTGTIYRTVSDRLVIPVFYEKQPNRSKALYIDWVRIRQTGIDKRRWVEFE